MAYGQPPAASGRRPLATVLLVMLGLVGASIVTLVIVGVLTSGLGGVRYANDDYTPPPPNLSPEDVPAPASLAQATEWTQQNPLYRQTMPEPLRCDLAPIDYPNSSPEAKGQYLNDFVACMMGGWDPVMQQAGFVMPRPSVIMYDPATNPKSKCGDLVSNNASYCALTQQLYVATDLEEIPTVAAARRGADFVIAHELGHAIQGRAGIIMARMALMQQASSDVAAYTINRRLEAQADCFAGLYLRAASRSLGLTDEDVQQWQALAQQLGGNKPGKTHPSGPSRVYWTSMGLSTKDIGQCNTFVTPDETVR